MKRRKFLFLSLLGLCISLVAVWYYKFNLMIRRDLSQSSDLALICDHDTLIQIGNTYRKKTGENNKKYLEELLLKDTGMNDSELKLLLKNKVEDDFAKGNTILIDGWLLSITEARQCALLSLSEAN